MIHRGCMRRVREAGTQNKRQDRLTTIDLCRSDESTIAEEEEEGDGSVAECGLECSIGEVSVRSPSPSPSASPSLPRIHSSLPH